MNACRKCHKRQGGPRYIEASQGRLFVESADGKKTEAYLKMIEGTQSRVAQQNVDADSVFSFNGPIVQYFSGQPESKIAFVQMDALEAIADSIERLKEHGIRMEICHVARQVFVVGDADLLPSVSVLSDGFK